jgi:hypothetical protein
MTNMNISSLNAVPKAERGGPMVEEGYSMITSKQTNTYLNI